MRRCLLFILLLLVCPATVRLPGAAATQAEIVVDSFADVSIDDGNCSLREALEAANLNIVVDGCAAGSPVGQDTITFSVDGTFFLGTELVVGGVVTIRGNGEGETILDGQVATRVIHLDAGGRGDIVLEQLTIRNGNASHESGGGVYGENHGHSLQLEGVTLQANRGEEGGGLAVYVSMEQTVEIVIRNSSFIDNFAGDSGGAIVLKSFNCSVCGGHLSVENGLLHGNGTYESGGGIFARGFSMTIYHSTLSANQADYVGGAIVSQSGLTLMNSTVSDNEAGERGGGIAHSGEGLMEVRNSTVVGNEAENVHLRSHEYDDVTAVFIDSLIANYGADNCVLSASPEGAPLPTIISLGYNVTDGVDCGFDEATDVTTTRLIMLRSLGPLQDNGGPTPTHALLPGNPAIDAGSCSGGAVSDDQRGVARPQGDGCNICAFELEGGNHQLYLPTIFK